MVKLGDNAVYFIRFCPLLMFSKSAFFSKSTTRVTNSLDANEAGRFVGPDLGPNCLEILSADNTSRQRVNTSHFEPVYIRRYRGAN